ncbi:MAG: hypothetical protein LKG31_02600 [Lactobacillus sp.]|jgi:Rgg/GadR/MutR family transcriptional activator|nr:hypothetical protein [Lactobacillus sp.]
MAYWHHNISKLESLSKQGLKEFHHNPNNFDNLFHATLACNTFLILSKINLFNETDVKKLVFALSNTELWSQEKIELFGSSLMRLPVRKINGIASLIINRADEIRKSNESQFINTMDMILNAVIALLERKELFMANKLIKRIDMVYVPENFVSIILRKKFYFALIKFCQTKNDFEIQNIFRMLSFLGLHHLLDDYQTDFKDLKQIFWPK